MKEKKAPYLGFQVDKSFDDLLKAPARNLPLKVSLGEGGSIERSMEKDKEVVKIFTKAGAEPIILTGVADLAKLEEGSGLKLSSFNSVGEWLNAAVESFYSPFSGKGGSTMAKNERGSGSFSFDHSAQIQVLATKEQKKENKLWAVYAKSIRYPEGKVPNQQEVNAFRDWLALMQRNSPPSDGRLAKDWEAINEGIPTGEYSNGEFVEYKIQRAYYKVS